MKVNRKIIYRGLKIFILFYCSIGIAFYYLQDRLVLRPVALDPSHVFKFNQPFTETTIHVNKTDSINLVKFLTKQPRKGILLYYHGNRSNIEWYAKYASAFTNRGYEVWMPDYPGFGKSTGDLTEENLYIHAFQVYKLATSVSGSDSILIYGKSFGTGIAAYVSSYSSPKAVILETPYPSIPELLNRFAFMYPTWKMSRFKIPTKEYLQDVKCPVIIFHGTEDGVIPYRFGARLKKYLKEGDRFITIEDGSHNDLQKFPSYNATLDSLLR